MKNTMKFLAWCCLVAFLGVNGLIILVLYVKWVSRMVGTL